MVVTTRTTEKAESKVGTKTGLFACPQCYGSLQTGDHSLTCTVCGQCYTVKAGQPDFRPQQPDEKAVKLDDTEKWQNQIKLFLRRSPRLYRFLVYVIGPALLLGPTSQTFVNRLGPQARVLSVGSGVMRLKGNVIHLDYEPYSHLEVVGDAHCLPFAEGAFDGVICETMLEHVQEPERVIAEMHRVLKPGGQIYVMMPFMFGFHAAPNDYYRFTHKGLLYRMRDFEPVQLKVIAGPASALTSVLIEWSAILFSFGSRSLYRLLTLFFMVLLAPLKLLDFLMCLHPEAIRIASVLLFIGTRK